MWSPTTFGLFVSQYRHASAVSNPVCPFASTCDVFSFLSLSLFTFPCFWLVCASLLGPFSVPENHLPHLIISPFLCALCCYLFCFILCFFSNIICFFLFWILSWYTVTQGNSLIPCPKSSFFSFLLFIVMWWWVLACIVFDITGIRAFVRIFSGTTVNFNLALPLWIFSFYQDSDSFVNISILWLNLYFIL